MRGLEICLLNDYNRVVNDLTVDHGPVPAAFTALTLQKYAVTDPNCGVTLIDLAVKPVLPKATVANVLVVDI